MNFWFPILRADVAKIVSKCGEKSATIMAVWTALQDIADQHLSLIHI